MCFITLMKAIATLLVMNSHCDNILPISALATGGSIGDTFFFAVSGFALFKSVNAPFGKYVRRRIGRLYPSIIIASLIIIFLDPAFVARGGMCDFRHFSFQRFLMTFIYPTSYRFLSALIAYYIIYYVILHLGRTSKTKVLIITLAVVVTLYAIYYVAFLDVSGWSIESYPIKYLYWFIPFLAGGCIRSEFESLIKYCKNKGKVFSLMSLVLFLVFYVVKVALQRCGLMYLQFIIHIVEIMFLLAFFGWMLSVETSLVTFSQKKCWKVVKYLSSITLENYLFMDFVIRRVYDSALRFPFSYICVFAITFVFSGALKFSVSKLSSIVFWKEKS